jgi:hypothetical protein
MKSGTITELLKSRRQRVAWTKYERADNSRAGAGLTAQGA